MEEILLSLLRERSKILPYFHSRRQNFRIGLRCALIITQKFTNQDEIENACVKYRKCCIIHFKYQKSRPFFPMLSRPKVRPHETLVANFLKEFNTGTDELSYNFRNCSKKYNNNLALAPTYGCASWL